jgi:hypothetical protein
MDWCLDWERTLDMAHDRWGQLTFFQIKWFFHQENNKNKWLANEHKIMWSGKRCIRFYDVTDIASLISWTPGVTKEVKVPCLWVDHESRPIKIVRNLIVRVPNLYWMITNTLNVAGCKRAFAGRYVAYAIGTGHVWRFDHFDGLTRFQRMRNYTERSGYFTSWILSFGRNVVFSILFNSSESDFLTHNKRLFKCVFTHGTRNNEIIAILFHNGKIRYWPLWYILTCYASGKLLKLICPHFSYLDNMIISCFTFNHRFLVFSLFSRSGASPKPRMLLHSKYFQWWKICAGIFS